MILDVGLRYGVNGLDYFWVKFPDKVRLISLKELYYIPVEARGDPDLLGKTWAMLRGLYAAKVDFCYVACGIFSSTPRPIGLVQFYGAIAEGEEEKSAREELLRRLLAFEATFCASFPQAKLRPPDSERLSWLLSALTTFPSALALIGNPDPRKAPRGLGRDGDYAGAYDDEFASQQNEILFRGLAKLREDFLFLLLSERVCRGTLAKMLEAVSREAGNIASRVRGVRSINFGLSIPVIAAVGRGEQEGRGYTEGKGHTSSTDWAESWGRAHTDSHSYGIADTRSHTTTRSWATTHGFSESTSVQDTTSHAEMRSHTDSHSWGVAHTSGSSWATSTTTGSSTAVSQGVTHSTGVADTHGTAHTRSHTIATSAGFSSGQTISSSHTHSSNVTTGHSVGESHAFNKHIEGGVSAGASAGMSVGIKVVDLKGEASAGINAGGGVGWTDTRSSTSSVEVGEGHAYSTGVAHSASTNFSVSHAAGSASTEGVSHTTSSGTAASSTTSVSTFTSTTTTSGGFSSETRSESWGTADTRGTTDGTAHSTGVTKGTFTSTTTGGAESFGTSHTRSEAWGRADTVSYAWGRGHSEAETVSSGTSRQISSGTAALISGGVVPSVSVGRSWNVEQDEYEQLARLLRLVEEQLSKAASEGGYLVDAYLLTRNPDALRAAAALAVTAFHGDNVPTPVRPKMADCIIEHARTFTPCPEPDPALPALGGYKLSSLLTLEQVAAYVAPGLFEEGTALTMQERLPPLGFYPDLEGITLGHFYSPETGELTETPLRLSRESFMHCAFVADSGFGKSVAAERLALETTVNWHFRTIVLDFGAGWRKLLTVPELRGHVDFYSLRPGGPRPLRWNPLQIGKRIPPEIQWRAFADVFGTIAQAGTRRQLPELRDALQMVYLSTGVLVDDPALPPRWQVISAEDEEAINAARAERGLPPEAYAGRRLEELTAWEKQAVAVARSRNVGLADLYAEIERRYEATPERDTMLRGVLSGLLYRLHPLVRGAAARQYAAGRDSIAIEDLGLPWGIVIIEGGQYLDEFSKAFLLGWLAWHLYTDATLRRGGKEKLPPMQIFFEEANKVLAGVDNSGEEGGERYVSDQFAKMWRDGRKYEIFLHVIAQSPSLLPRGILSSCPNLFIGQLQDPEDANLAIAALARSEKGFVDEPYRRLLRRLGVGQFLVRFGYGPMYFKEPMLVRPAIVKAREPSDDEIMEMFA
ncbi:MAG: serine-rich protein [Candidatus Hadarchaeales archaeon]